MNDNDRVANDSHGVSNISNNETTEPTEHERARDDDRPSQNTEGTEPVPTQTHHLPAQRRGSMAKTGGSEKLIGIEGDKALVTLVTTYEASKLRRTASYKGKRDNDVSRERSG